MNNDVIFSRLGSNQVESKPNPEAKPKLPDLNINVYKELERQTVELSNDFCHLNNQLRVSLNQISAATVCCLQTYSEAVDRLYASINECVNEEKLLVDKAKDLCTQLEPIYRLQQKITLIKTMLSSLESEI